MPAKFQNVILEEAARSNPLDLLIPMTRALRRIILVGDQKQLPQLIENDIVEDVVSEKFDDLAERDIARKKYESSLFGVLYKNLEKAPKKRMIRLNEQFRMHPAIGNFISSLYYDNEVKAGMKDQELKKSHGLTVNGLKDKVMVFCNVSHEQGYEKKGIGKSRECEAKRVMSLVKEIMSDPGGKDLSIGVITFYAAQRDLIFDEAEKMGFANRLPSGDYEIDDSVKATRDGREKFRIGTVDSFQGKEFDVVILSATRSNTIERKEGNVRKVFGFLTSENRLNVAFSRAQRLLIVCGDAVAVVETGAVDAGDFLPLRLVVVGVDRADTLACGSPEVVSDRIFHDAEEDVEVAGGERISFRRWVTHIVGVVDAHHAAAP